jgi:hypothetical protein
MDPLAIDSLWLSAAVAGDFKISVNTVSATAGAPDPNLGNNSAVVVTSVLGSRH